jgi:hypothetical protein
MMPRSASLDPDLPRREVRLAPAVPDRVLPLRLENVPLAQRRVEIEVSATGVEVRGLPPSVVLLGSERPDPPDARR